MRTGKSNFVNWSSAPGWNGGFPRAGRISWFLGLFLRLLILVYKYSFSALFPPSCRYSPSCSSYGLEAIQKYGAFRGSVLTMKRILRCRPGHPGGYDPVP